MNRPSTDQKTASVSQSDLARLRGCARSTVSRACKPGGALVDALLSPDRLDLHHPAVQEFLGRAAAPTNRARLAPRIEMVRDEPEPKERRAALDSVDLALKQARLEERLLKNEATAGLSVRRETVSVSVFGPINALEGRVLREIKRSLVIRLSSAARSGSTIEELEAMYDDAIRPEFAAVRAAAIDILGAPS